MFAVIFLGYIEQEHLWPSWHKPKPLYFKQYIDNIFIIWPYSLFSLQWLRDRYSTGLPTIKVSGRIHDDKVNFLNIVIFKGNRFNTTGYLDTKSAIKTVNLYLYIPGWSWHTNINITAWVTAKLNRHIRLSSDILLYAKQAHLFYSHLRAHEYPSKWLVCIFKSINYNTSRAKALENGPKNTSALHLNPSLHIKTFNNTRLSGKLWTQR